jgi:hypothetical protein
MPHERRPPGATGLRQQELALGAGAHVPGCGREGRAEGRAEGRTEGRSEGRADEARSLLLKVLAARSLPVTPDVRARIDREPDLARLESWLEAAVTATAIGDVFRDS